jgi:hypothetical protein
VFFAHRFACAQHANPFSPWFARFGETKKIQKKKKIEKKK